MASPSEDAGHISGAAYRDRGSRPRVVVLIGDPSDCEAAARSAARDAGVSVVEVDSIPSDFSIGCESHDGAAAATPTSSCDYATAYARGVSLTTAGEIKVAVVRSLSSFLGADAQTGLVAGVVDAARGGGVRAAWVFLIAGRDPSGVPETLRSPRSYCEVALVSGRPEDDGEAGDASRVARLLEAGCYERAYAEARARAGRARHHVTWTERAAASVAAAALEALPSSCEALDPGARA